MEGIARSVSQEPEAFVHAQRRRVGRLGSDHAEGVGALVICEPDHKLKGVISERDIVRAIVDYGPRALQMKAADFMDAHPATCTPGLLCSRLTARRWMHCGAWPTSRWADRG